MRSIAIWAEKGGTCKSTTAVNLAAALGAMGKRVLLVDLDPQATATHWLGWIDKSASLLSVLTDMTPLSPLIQESRAPGVYLVPSDGRSLRNAEHVLRGEVGGDRRLAMALKKVRDGFDYLLCDTPPAAGLLAASALEACSEALVPLDTSAMSTRTLETVFETLRRCNQGGCEIDLLGILMSRYTAGTRISREILAFLEERYPAALLTTRIHESTRLRECFSFNLPINLYAPASPAAEAFQALGQEVEARHSLPVAPVEEVAHV